MIGTKSSASGACIAAVVLSAELAPDGGSAPDVKCTVVTRGLDGNENGIMNSSICRGSWSPFWDEATRIVCVLSALHCELECILWDESCSPPACLGECVLNVLDLENLMSTAKSYEYIEKKVALGQNTDTERRIVGHLLLKLTFFAARIVPESFSGSPTPTNLIESNEFPIPPQHTQISLQDRSERHGQNGKGIALDLIRGAPHCNDYDPKRTAGIGLGMQATENGMFVITSFLDGTSSALAAESGLVRVGDVISSVNGTYISGKSVEEVVHLIKGPEGTNVTLFIKSTIGIEDKQFPQKLSSQPTFRTGSFETPGNNQAEHTITIQDSPREEKYSPAQAPKKSASNECSSEDAGKGDQIFLMNGHPDVEMSASNLCNKKPCLTSYSRRSHTTTPASSVEVIGPLSKISIPTPIQERKMSQSPQKHEEMRGIRDGTDASKLVLESVIDSQKSQDEEFKLDSPTILNDLLKPVNISSEGDLEHVLQTRHASDIIERKQPFYFRMAALIVSIIAVALVLGSTGASTPWHVLAWCSVSLIGISPWSLTAQQYFGGYDTNCKSCFRFLCSLTPMPENAVPMWWVAISSFVTALFGDALHVSAVLSYQYGVTGSAAIACWYGGVIIMGIIVFGIRMRFPHMQSLFQAIHSCYGYSAASLFSGLVLYRLLNVIVLSLFTASNLFASQSNGLYWGGLVSGVAPCIYAMTGGLRATIVTEALQGLAVLSLLAASIAGILGSETCWICDKSDWVWDDTQNLSVARVIQGSLSLPWCCAVLTHRLFALSPGKSLVAFLIGISLAGAYTFAGVFFGMQAHKSPTENLPNAFAESLGQANHYLFVITTMLTTMAAIGSSLIAASKLGGMEVWTILFQLTSSSSAQPLSAGLTEGSNIVAGRTTILLVAAGSSIIFFLGELRSNGPEGFASLSGVMSLGLGPPCLLLSVWNNSWKRSPLAFILPVVVSLILGGIHRSTGECSHVTFDVCLHYTNSSLSTWTIGEGQFGNELGLTVYTLLLCFFSCALGFAVDQHLRGRDSPRRVETPVSYGAQEPL